MDQYSFGHAEFKVQLRTSAKASMVIRATSLIPVGHRANGKLGSGALASVAQWVECWPES